MFTKPTTPAGTKVRESLGKKREGTLTGEGRWNRRNVYQHLVDFNGETRWCTWLIIVED